MKLTIVTIITISLIVLSLTIISLALTRVTHHTTVATGRSLIVEDFLVYEGGAAVQDFLISEGIVTLEDLLTHNILVTVDAEAFMQDDMYVMVNAEVLPHEESQGIFYHYTIVVAVIFILAGAILAYIISRQTLKPIKTLADKIENIDANNLDTPIKPPKANDELSSLTHSFNNMLGKLNRSFNSHKLFAQNAAHELKTPLASIMANVEVLQLDDEPSTEEYKEVVGVVKDNTARLIDLVEGLLSANNAIDETCWQRFGVSEVFEAIIKNLNDDIERKHLNVDLSGECHIRGDKVLLERAFQNLINNAVRYNIENGTIKISLENDVISIEDSGIGIPKENLENIFEPFYCVDSSRSKNLGGHGLGMTIAKNIFDMHKIKIHVSSEAGKGTKIILEI